MADGKGRRPRRQFDREFKAQAVRLVLEEGQSVTAVARDLDLARTALHNWVEQARADRSGGKTGLTTVEREELARLRKEVRILQEERDILKNECRATVARPVDQKLPRQYAPLPEAVAVRFLVSQPVKKHGPGVACAPVSGDA